MFKFIDTLTYFENQLKTIKRLYEDNMISKEKALEKINNLITELEEKLYEYDLIYPYKWLKTLQDVLEDCKDFASSLKTNENTL